MKTFESVSADLIWSSIVTRLLNLSSKFDTFLERALIFFKRARA